MTPFIGTTYAGAPIIDPACYRDSPTTLSTVDATGLSCAAEVVCHSPDIGITVEQCRLPVPRPPNTRSPPAHHLPDLGQAEVDVAEVEVAEVGLGTAALVGVVVGSVVGAGILVGLVTVVWYQRRRSTKTGVATV